MARTCSFHPSSPRAAFSALLPRPTILRTVGWSAFIWKSVGRGTQSRSPISRLVRPSMDGLTNREIGERLCVPLPTDFQIKADHPTVRKMVGRGRRALKAALGEDGWKEQVRAMKEEAEAWRSRSPVQRQAELEAEALGVPYEEVLRRLEEGSRRSSEESKHGIREGVAF